MAVFSSSNFFLVVWLGRVIAQYKVGPGIILGDKNMAVNEKATDKAIDFDCKISAWFAFKIYRFGFRKSGNSLLFIIIYKPFIAFDDYNN